MPASPFQNFHITYAQANQTLAAALRHFKPDQTWSKIRQLIEKRHVQVNGNLTLDQGRRLKDGDVVKVWTHPLAPPPRGEDIRIRHLDAHIVVIEKPAGVTTLRHAEERKWPQQRKQRQPTLDEMVAQAVANAVAKKTPAPAKKGARGTALAKKVAKPHKPHVTPVRAVHRLDRDTSGLMVFARTVPAERNLVQQFRNHTVERTYIAIAHGDVPAQTIQSRLMRDRGDGRRGSTTNPKLGKHAVTHLQPVEKLTGYTVLKCKLETGRTHQIRIHLAESGHMLCGEKVYRQAAYAKPSKTDTSGAPRHALHAAELGFEHPLTGERMHFEMPLPADLAEFLKRLRKKTSTGQGGPKVE